MYDMPTSNTCTNRMDKYRGTQRMQPPQELQAGYCQYQGEHPRPHCEQASGPSIGRQQGEDEVATSPMIQGTVDPVVSRKEQVQGSRFGAGEAQLRAQMDCPSIDRCGIRTAHHTIAAGPREGCPVGQAISSRHAAQ